MEEEQSSFTTFMDSDLQNLKITVHNALYTSEAFVSFFMKSLSSMLGLLDDVFLGSTSGDPSLRLFSGPECFGNFETIFATHLSSKRNRQMTKTKVTDPMSKREMDAV